MSRIHIINESNANSEQQVFLNAIQNKLGIVPNFLKVFANSPTALRAFLGLHSVSEDGSLDAITRERIALAIAQQNQCQYCVSAHTAIGKKSGLDSTEIKSNRSGTSQNEKASIAIKFAQTLVEYNGEITTEELNEVRIAGYTDADIVEIITHVGMNILTNIIGKVSQVDIDFPEVSLELPFNES